MRIHIIAIGRLKERYWKEAADEYLKRLRPYATVRVTEVPDRDPGRDAARALAEESADATRAIPGDAYVIALAVDAPEVSSEGLARRLEQLAVDGRGSVAFVVGGSSGLSDDLESAADERMSFGPITLPHNLARVVLLEQLYRAFKIIKREPYHK